MSIQDTQRQWWQRSRAATSIELIAPFDLNINDRSISTELEILGTPECWFRAADLATLERFGVAIVNAVHAERVRQRNDEAARLDFGAV